jgi:hypothetical protein
MSIESQEDLDALRAAGRVAAGTLTIEPIVLTA